MEIPNPAEGLSVAVQRRGTLPPLYFRVLFISDNDGNDSSGRGDAKQALLSIPVF